MNLVFVCTGNICRSPMAEGMFKKLLEEKGESGIVCSSAGLATFGRPPRKRQCAERCARIRRGYLGASLANAYEKYSAKGGFDSLHDRRAV